VFNDFATEDYVNKNIRMRPVSGLGDETKDGRQSNVSRGQVEDKEDLEDNFNTNAQIEIENERKQKKLARKKKEEEAERKAALAEAIKRKKNSE
jgi:hypothetical protein